MGLFDSFGALPLMVRAALVLGMLLLIWLLLAKPILWALSLLPWFLRLLFHGLCLLLGWPLSGLHKLIGGGFYHVNNKLAAMGEHVDGLLAIWYQAWHHPQKRYFGIAFVVVLVCLAAVILPEFLHIEPRSWLYKGEALYLQIESYASRWLEMRGLLDLELHIPSASRPTAQPTDETVMSPSTFQTTLTVHNVSSTLSVRDIPSTDGATTLASLKNGQTATWYGRLAFGYAEGRQEAWVEVSTSDGVIGWCRLAYLEPEVDTDLILSASTVG